MFVHPSRYTVHPRSPTDTLLLFYNKQHKSYEQILWFRNNDYVPRRIKIETPTSGDFSVRRMRGKKGGTLREVTSPTTDGNDGMAIQSLKNGRPTADNALGKVAPGMEVAFKVRFTPKDREDYNIDLVCVTEREKFLVPVVCVGDKPALDFPDSVTFDPTPAKCRSAVTRVIRNAGSKTAHFRFWVPEPFAVFPSEGTALVLSPIRQHTVLPKLVTVVHTSRYTRR